MNVTKQMTWADIGLGVWLLAAPFIIGYQLSRPVTVIEDLLPGIFLCVTSVWILAMKTGRMRTRWIQALCGLWLMVGSVVLMFSGMPSAALNAIVIGTVALAVNAVAMYSAVRQSETGGA